MNGNIKRDWEAEYIYVKVKGSTVIDYMFVNENMLNGIKEFKIDERINSDHMPLCLI